MRICKLTLALYMQTSMSAPQEPPSVIKMLTALTPMEATLVHVKLDTVEMDLLAQVSFIHEAKYYSGEDLISTGVQGQIPPSTVYIIMQLLVFV